MTDFLFIFAQVFGVFLTFFASYLFGRWRAGKLDLTILSEIILYIGCPCVVFSTIVNTRYEVSEIGVLVGALVWCVVFVAAFNFISGIIFRKKHSNLFYFSTMFMNTSSIGFPLMLFLFGQAAFEKAVIFYLAMITLLFSLGVSLISKKYTEIFRLPVLYAAALGFVISFNGWTLPEFIFKPIVLMGGMTVPLMIVLLGCEFARLGKIKKVKTALSVALTRALVGLLGGLTFVALFSVTGLTAKVIILCSCLPVPVMTYVIAQKYRQDEKTAAEIVILSNLCAVIVLPLVIFLFLR